MEQEQAFKGDALYSGYTEGTLVDAHFSVRVDNSMWTRPGEAAIISDQFFLEWLMFREEDVECARPGKAFVPSRGVILVPPGRQVRTRWKHGRIRTVSCCFRREMLNDCPDLLDALTELDGDIMFSLKSPFMEACLSRIADEAIAPGMDSEFMVRSTLLSLCGEIRRTTMTQPDKPEVRGALSPGQMQRLREVLHEADGRLPAIGDLARHCGVMPRALPALVKRATGVTLRHYIAQERLNRAKGLLDNRTLMIKQVAYSCGFASAAAFTAAFRKTTGMTPVEYRARC